MTIHQRHRILESLDSMDLAQMEKVLQYIKGVLSEPVRESAEERQRREAMRQIREALIDKQARGF